MRRGERLLSVQGNACGEIVLEIVGVGRKRAGEDGAGWPPPARRTSGRAVAPLEPIQHDRHQHVREHINA